MPTTDFTPTIAELATFMKNRTKSRYGAVVGAFNADTPVTDTEAEDLIAQAVDEMALAVGSDLPTGPDDDPDLYRRGAKQAVLLLSAMNVELAISGEQVNDVRSPYAALERRLNGVNGKGGLRSTLIESVAEKIGLSGAEAGESVAVDDVTIAIQQSFGSFPAPAGFERRRW